MPGSLITSITGASQVTYGVNILEVTPPGQISGVRTNLVGIVGDFPWGPVDVIQSIGSTAQFFETFCPDPFDAKDDYVALKAFLNKRFPGGLRIARISPTGQAAADSGALTAGTGTVTITAKYPGALGNSISYQFTAASDGDAAKRDVFIRIGANYEAQYKNVEFGTITDIDDDYVDITSSSPTAMPTAGSETLLTSGADGTAAAADYTGSGVGLQLFYGESVDVDVLFVAECPDALVDDVNTGIKAYVDTKDKGMAVLCTPDAQDAATAETYVASYRSDRLAFCWPKVKTTNFYSANTEEITVDGCSFYATALASVEPENSPGGAAGRPYFSGITGLEDESTPRATLVDLKAAGVSCWMMESSLGAIIRGAVTTSITSGETKIFRRRMTDYILESIASRAVNFVGFPMDLNLSTQTLGRYTGALIGEIQQFLNDLKDNERVKDVTSVDAFSGNLSSNIDAGIWYIDFSVKLFSMQESIVLRANIGEFVEIS